MDNKKNVTRWVPLRLLIDELERRGYRLLEFTDKVCVLKSPRPATHSVVVTASGTQLPDMLVRSILHDEPIDAEEIIDAVDRRTRDMDVEQQDQLFKIDLEAATEILETTPHPPARRSHQDLKVAAEILERIESEEISGTEPTDVSENLDKYLY